MGGETPPNILFTYYPFVARIHSAFRILHPSFYAFTGVLSQKALMFEGFAIFS